MVSFSIQKYRGFTLGISEMNMKLEKDEDYETSKPGIVEISMVTEHEAQIAVLSDFFGLFDIYIDQNTSILRLK